MGLVLVCVVRILHDDWSITLGENKSNRALKHLVAMLPTTENVQKILLTDVTFRIDLPFGLFSRGM